MDLGDSPEQAAYREQVRTWIAEHGADAPEPGDVEAHRGWQRRLAEAGLCAVHWPTEYGGQGRGVIDQLVVDQELVRAEVPGPLDFMGLEMLGPTIIEHGTDEQRRRYLGPLLRGEEIWCQLFSEPAAGSDLAGIHARAHREEGGWRLRGQKVWTTHAHIASFGLALARTDPDVPKHGGLTMFVVPMDADGVTVRPLLQVSGEHEFNEVFLDDVIVDDGAVVGGVGGGWRTALTTLMFERMMLSAFADRPEYRAERFARALARVDESRCDPVVRQALGEAAGELLAVRFGGARTLTALARGEQPGPESALGKMTFVNAATRATDLVVDVLGPAALADGGEWWHMTSYMPGVRSGGGTEEILRNTVGERVLGLPAEPRLDKGVPFSELRTAAPS